MPNIIIVNGYRFFFNSNDHLPIHIHVEKDGKTTTFNLEPTELRKARLLVKENTKLFKQKWDGYFNQT